MRSLRILPYAVFALLCMNFLIFLCRGAYFYVPVSVSRFLSIISNVWWIAMTGYIFSHIIVFNCIFGLLNLSQSMWHVWHFYIFTTIAQSFRLNTMALIQRAEAGKADTGFLCDLVVSQLAAFLEIASFYLLMRAAAQTVEMLSESEIPAKFCRRIADICGFCGILFHIAYFFIRLLSRQGAVSPILLYAYPVLFLLWVVLGFLNAFLLNRNCRYIWLFVYNGTNPRRF